MSRLCKAILLTSLSLGLSVQAQQKPEDKRMPEAPKTTAPSPDRPEVGGLPIGGGSSAAGAGAPVDPNTFEIGPEDVIRIEVWHDTDFTAVHVVRPDGKISLPLVGEIQAGGTTPVQLGKVVTEKLSAIIRDPQVTVSVGQVNSKRYYIQGEVNRTGAFPLVVPTRVLEALTNAGGFRDFANRKKITILRKDNTRRTFNYNEVVRGKKMEQNVFLENGDYIIVP